MPWCTQLKLFQCNLKHKNLLLKPVQSKIETLSLVDTDIYGHFQFDVLQELVASVHKFKSLKKLHTSGFFEESSLLALLQSVDELPSLVSIKLKRKAFFNHK